MCCLSFLSYNFVKFVYFGFIIIYCFNWIINRFFSCFKFGLTKPDSNLDIVFLIPCNFQIYSLIQIIHSISHILMNEKKKIRKQLFFEQKYCLLTWTTAYSNLMRKSLVYIRLLDSSHQPDKFSLFFYPSIYLDDLNWSKIWNE